MQVSEKGRSISYWKKFLFCWERKWSTIRKRKLQLEYPIYMEISYNLYWHKHEQLHLPSENSAARGFNTNYQNTDSEHHSSSINNKSERTILDTPQDQVQNGRYTY